MNLDFVVCHPLTPEQVQDILSRPQWATSKASTVQGGRVQSSTRNAFTSWAAYKDPMFDMMLDFTIQANKAFMMDGLRMDVESVQLTTYPVGGHYQWHTDRGSIMHSFHSRRRLSITVQLDDPATYEGGRLQLNFGHGEIFDMPTALGSVIVFPSYVLHQVTPVTKGVRRSLVSWVR